MKQIAEAADTSVAQLYLIFPSKQILLAEAYQRGTSRLLDGFLRPAMEMSGDDWERASRAFQAYASFFLKEPKLASLMVFTSFADLDQDDPEVQALLAAQVKGLSEVFGLLGPATSGSSTEAEHLLRWVWAAIYGLAVHNMRLPHLGVQDEEFRRVVDAGLRLVQDGLEAQRGRRAAAAEVAADGEAER